MSKTFCVAAGINDVKVGTWLWNGSSWAGIDPGLHRSYSPEISCASSTFCLLAYQAGGTARFDGAHWSVLTPLSDGDF